MLQLEDIKWKLLGERKGLNLDIVGDDEGFGCTIVPTRIGVGIVGIGKMTVVKFPTQNAVLLTSIDVTRADLREFNQFLKDLSTRGLVVDGAGDIIERDLLNVDFKINSDHYASVWEGDEGDV